MIPISAFTLGSPESNSISLPAARGTPACSTPSSAEWVPIGIEYRFTRDDKSLLYSERHRDAALATRGLGADDRAGALGPDGVYQGCEVEVRRGLICSHAAGNHFLGGANHGIEVQQHGDAVQHHKVVLIDGVVHSSVVVLHLYHVLFSGLHDLGWEQR